MRFATADRLFFGHDGQGSGRVRLELETAEAFPFVVRPEVQSRHGEVPFEKALVRAEGATSPCPIDLVHIERNETRWFFPVRQIGLLGAVVECATGRCAALGTGLGTNREALFWCFDRHLVGVTPARIRVTRVHDIEVAAWALARFAGRGDRALPEVEAALRELPRSFEGARNGIGVGALYDAREAFDFEVEQPAGG